ncbi:MAG: hypothetical protein H6816_13645 [Phycisphaerales bacterium]|nr:hypothetical protein [Phycisphaerales bacterium]
MLAAHEIRDPLRAAFADELFRIVEPGGQVILVEHLRDAANFVAFGPGAWHFYSRRTWDNLAVDHGFTVASSRMITPFVRAAIWRKKPWTQNCTYASPVP